MSQKVNPLDPYDVIRRPHRYFRRKYVWQWPVRIFHWVNALSITVLFLTGLYINHPILAPAGEPYTHFVMGRIRQIHFFFAFLFTLNFVWRIYWFWAGNNYARSGFPFVWRKKWWSDLFRQVLDYIKLERGHVHLGHNALGGLTYTIFVIGLGLGQIFTGFALYSESHPDGIVAILFGWVIPLIGNSFETHMIHHWFSWGFVFFTILHLYIVAYDGSIYKNGLVTSMVSGVKFYQDDDLDNDTWLS